MRVSVFGEQRLLEVDRHAYVVGDDSNPLADDGPPVRSGQVEHAVLLRKGLEQDSRVIEQDTEAPVTSALLRERFRPRVDDSVSWHGGAYDSR